MIAVYDKVSGNTKTTLMMIILLQLETIKLDLILARCLLCHYFVVIVHAYTNMIYIILQFKVVYYSH